MDEMSDSWQCRLEGLLRGWEVEGQPEHQEEDDLMRFDPDRRTRPSDDIGVKERKCACDRLQARDQLCEGEDE